MQSAHDEMVRLVKKHPFDCGVLITYNTETKLSRNAWHFAELRYDKEELIQMAYMMTSAAAEQFKGDVNYPDGKEVTLKPQRKIQSLPKDDSVLVSLGLAWPDPNKPFFFYIKMIGYSFGLMCGFFKADKFAEFYVTLCNLRFRFIRKVKP